MEAELNKIAPPLVSQLIRRLGVRLSSSEIRGLVKQGDEAREARRWVEAFAFYKSAVESAPHRTDILVQMGHAAKELRQFDTAAACYFGALEDRPNDDDLYLQIGHFEKVRGNPKAAVEWYLKAATLNPLNVDAKQESEALRWASDLPVLPVSLAQPDDGIDHRILGDRHSESHQWASAALAYETHLRGYPHDIEVYVKAGNCWMEAAEPLNAEAAFRSGLGFAPNHADLNRLLGRALKSLGRVQASIQAFERAFQFNPTLDVAAILVELGMSPGYSAVAAAGGVQAGARTKTRNFIDIADLLRVMSSHSTVSGIQRVQFALLRYILDHDSSDYDFVTWFDGQLWVLPPDALSVIVDMHDRGSTIGLEQRRKSMREAENTAVLADLRPGDIFFSVGVLYFRPDIVAENWRLKRAGVRLGALIYDYIPLSHPEYVAKFGVLQFSAAMAENLLMLDFALTISEHVASETKRLLAEGGYPPIPVTVLPLAHMFTESANPGSALDANWTSRLVEFQDGEYVLCVGSSYAHKNHKLLLQVWQILLQNGLVPPQLVLAGKHSNQHNDVHQQLASSSTLRNHVRIIEAPSDEELSVLYRNCLFTMLPSFVEGWGLPVGESLAYGKVCLAADGSSIPEVGGDFVLYFDPYNARDCAALVARLLGDRAELAAKESQIRDRFIPRGWDEVGAACLTAFAALAAALNPDEHARSALLAVPPGTIHRTRRRTVREWEFGLALPPVDTLTASVRPRLILDQGWYGLESWGVWMKADAAQLDFLTTLPPGTPVKVALQLTVAPWAAGNSVTATSPGGASTTITLPPSLWPERVWQFTALVLTTEVGSGRRIRISLQIQGPRVKPWWGHERDYTIGLRALFWSSDNQPTVLLQPNTFLSAARTAGQRAPVLASSPADFRNLLCKAPILGQGWQEQEAWGCWIEGENATVWLRTTLPPDTAIRIAAVFRPAAGARTTVNLSAKPAGSALHQASVASITAASLIIDGEPDATLMLDGLTGADGSIELMIELVPHVTGSRKRPAYPLLGLIGLAYGCQNSVEDRLSLTEALLFRNASDGGAETDSDPAAAEDDEISFTVVGHMKGSYSLAAVNRALALALETGFPGRVRIEQVETEPMHDLEGLARQERRQISDLAARAPLGGGPEIVIAQHWPVYVPETQGDLLLAWIAWEESHLPGDMVERLDRNFQGILVQTRSVRKSLIDSGVRLPIGIMGCAPELTEHLAVGGRRARRPLTRKPTRNSPLVFLHVSSCFPRKGADLLLKAYVQTFTGKDPVKLVIKTFPNIHNDIENQVSLLRRHPNLPFIEIISQDLSATAMSRLYESADHVVLPTRGEGFNLPAAEALAAGVPLIVTGFGAQLDFAGADVARLLRYRFDYSRTHLMATASVWAEPDLADLSAALREAFEAHISVTATASVQDRVNKGRDVARQLARPAPWAMKVAEISRNILRQPVVASPAVAWVSTWNIRCGIAEYSRQLLESYPNHANDIVVLHDERTELAGPGCPARAAWRVHDGGSIGALARAIDETRAPVVVIQHHKGLIRWSDLTALLNDPRVAHRHVVVTIHNVQEFAEGDQVQPLIDALHRTARVLVHTVNDLNLLLERGLVDNVTLFPHGAHSGRVQHGPPRPLPHTASPLIGAYGFFLPHKGFAELIKAFAILRQTWPAARLRLVTAEYPNTESRDEIATCRLLAEKLELFDIEWLTDYLPNSVSLSHLGECDLVVLPYQETPESSSAALRNALTSGAPVAVTPIRIFDDAEPAVLRMGGINSQAIAQSIKSFLEDQDRRTASIAAASRWLDSHSWPIMAKRLQGMLTSLLVNAEDGIG